MWPTLGLLYASLGNIFTYSYVHTYIRSYNISSLQSFEAKELRNKEGLQKHKHVLP